MLIDPTGDSGNVGHRPDRSSTLDIVPAVFVATDREPRTAVLVTLTEPAHDPETT